MILRYTNPRTFLIKLQYGSTKHLSTTQKGTAFEEKSLKMLQENLSMSLKRVGGKEDGGIDLLGWWWLPSLASDSSGNVNRGYRRLRVIAQCKAEKKKLGPSYVRELEGVLHRFITVSTSTTGLQDYDSKEPNRPAELSEPSASQVPLVGLLVSESPFTKSALLRAHSSPIPFLLLHIPSGEDAYITSPQSSDDTRHSSTGIGSAVWNPALAGSRGLLQGQMEIRWERSFCGGGRPGLWLNNDKLPGLTPTDALPDGFASSEITGH